MVCLIILPMEVVVVGVVVVVAVAVVVGAKWKLLFEYLNEFGFVTWKRKMVMFILEI